MQFTLNISNKKLLKRILAVSLPIFVVGASISTYLIKTKGHNASLVNNNVSIVNGVKRQVYLLNNENLVLPVTVTIESKELITDEIKELMNLLKKENNKFNNILDKDCELKNVTLENDTLTLNFNEKFYNYDLNNEKRIVESLVWTCLQYDEINNLKIQVEDVDLQYMPLNNTPLPSNLNKEIGINNHLSVKDTTKKSVNVFFETSLENEKYYVPVTVKVDDYENDYQEIIEGLNSKLPLYCNLKIPSIKNKIEVLKYSELDDTYNLNLELSNKALFDEKTIDNSVFDYLVMNLIFNDENIKTVSVTVNDEIMQVSGYEDSSIQVSNIIYNEIKL